MYLSSFLLIPFLIVVCFGIEDPIVKQKWREYRSKFGKSYRSVVEDQKRFAIFEQNLKEIEEHNVLYERGVYTYKKGFTKFTDWSTEEFIHFLNRGLKPSRGTAINTKVFNKTEGFVLPESIDWRDKGAVTFVDDQGKCGACWTFSATGAIEGQLKLKRGELIKLSEQNIMDCTNGTHAVGCDGGETSAAFDFVKISGIESEDDYPYIEEKAECSTSPSKIVTKISDYVKLRARDEHGLEQAVATQGPIAISMQATENLKNYIEGIFDDPKCTRKSVNLNHAVLAVGFGVQERTKYFIVKNSWGLQWGEDGYFRIRRGRNICGIANEALYPIL